MSAPGLAARQAAAQLLTGVLADRKTLLEQVDDKDGPLKDLAPSERARAQSITAGVLRQLDAIDAVLDKHLKKAPPLKVTQALRIAAWEMLVDKIAPHAAVDAAVNGVKSSRKVAFLSGLTNAVSRKLAKLAETDWTPNPQAFPPELRQPMLAAWGEDATAAIEQAQSQNPPVDITVKNPREAEEIARDLKAEILPTGSLRLARPGQISALSGFEEGKWWVQDAAAAMPVKLLGNVDGLSVLDVCAAPGGKTMQLIAGGADVTALDSSKPRMKRLKENLKRTGLKAKTVTENVLNHKPDRTYDVIVLDAPCSATGTIRRHPDLPFVRKGVELKPMLTLQARMIARAAGWLNPGGRLLYCTCSLFPAEGEDHVAKLLANGFKVEKANLRGTEPHWINEQGALRLRPDYWLDKGAMDGFFAAVLTKPAR